MRDIDVAPLPLSHLESHLDEVAIKRLHTSLTGAEALLEGRTVWTVTPSAAATPPRRAGSSAQPTLGELIARISENISALVRGEIDLAKAKGQRMVKEMGLGAGLLAAAGVLALFIFGLVLGAMTSGLSNIMPLWAAFLVVALLLTLIAVPMALIGIKRLKAAKADTPTPQDGLKESVNAVKGAVAPGRGPRRRAC